MSKTMIKRFEDPLIREKRSKDSIERYMDQNERDKQRDRQDKYWSDIIKCERQSAILQG